MTQISTETSSLTPAQEACVQFFPHSGAAKKHLVMEAGAGAGKTHVLMERIKHLLKENLVRPESLVLVTFTTAAALELKERLETTLCPKFSEAYQSIHVSTIDSFFLSCVQTLFPAWWQNEHHKKDDLNELPPSLQVVNESEIILEMKQLLSQYFLTSPWPKEQEFAVMDFILSGGFHLGGMFRLSTRDQILKTLVNETFLATPLENLRLPFQKVHPATTTLLEQLHIFAQQQYKKRLYEGRMTYADRTVFLYQNLDPKRIFPITELIVDEYQDTNHLQHSILLRLAEWAKGHMVVVGDPKQSLYSFRAADVSVMSSLTHDPHWECLKLETNFRSDPRLLKEMNTLSRISFLWQDEKIPPDFMDSEFYAEGKKRFVGPLPLSAGRSSSNEQKAWPYPVTILSYSAESCPSNIKANEILKNGLGIFIKSLVEQYRIPYKDLAFLCETNRQINVLSDVLKNQGIPLQGQQNTPLQENDHSFQVALALLKILSTAETLWEDPSLHTPWLHVLSSPLCALPWPQIEWIFLNKTLNAHPFYQKVLTAKKSPHHNMFALWQEVRWSLAFEHPEGSAERQKALGFCRGLNIFAAVLATHDHYPSEDIKDLFLASLKDHKSSLGHDGVLLTTVHRAKGLEWPYVFFCPAYQTPQTPSQFHLQRNQNGLDISWLVEDMERLSLIKRTQNIHFSGKDSSQNEKGETEWFFALRDKIERQYERQRVFYTAFTRAREGLFLVQPFLPPAARKSVASFLNDKKESFKSRLETHTFGSYMKITEENGLLDIQTQSTFTCPNVIGRPQKTVLLCDINPTEKSVLDAKKDSPPMSSLEQACFEAEPPPQDWPDKPVAEASSLPQAPFTLEKFFQSKTKGLEAREKGLQVHAKALLNPKELEAQFGSPFLKKALFHRHEFEIWTRHDHDTEKLKRNVLDLLILYHAAEFQECFLDTREQNQSPTLNQETRFVWLVMDLKTGYINMDHQEQIQRYLKVVRDLLPSSHDTEIFGLLWYQNLSMKVLVQKDV